jgi:hypothetical protein
MVGVRVGDVRSRASGRWTLIRVAPTMLERTVQHHFRAEIDGHKRRYILRHAYGKALRTGQVRDALSAVANAWDAETPGIGKTWLQRTDDGGTAVANSVIPYTHFGISLITLLRIGLSGNTKVVSALSWWCCILIHDCAADKALWSVSADSRLRGHGDMEHPVDARETRICGCGHHAEASRGDADVAIVRCWQSALVFF